MRLGWLDSLRGLIILLVVVFHAEVVVGRQEGHWLGGLHELNHVLGFVRMPALMVLSGILLSRSLAKGPTMHLRGKVAKIAWPYLVWSSLNLWQGLAYGSAPGARWAEIFYKPPTSHWFLAYLFVYFLVCTVLTAQARKSLIVPAMLLAVVVPDGLQSLMWLFGWFLAGDLLGRRVSADRRFPSVPVLAHLGRNSLTYYVSHLMVIVAVVGAMQRLGVASAWAQFWVALALGIAVGRALVRLRDYPMVNALFEWPARGGSRRRYQAPMLDGNRQRLSVAGSVNW
jgi:uncharacterized membrane protein YcfT